MAKVLVLRYNNGKFPPSAVTEKFKQQVGGAMEKYLKENIKLLPCSNLYFITVAILDLTGMLVE